MVSQACPPRACTMASSAARACLAFFTLASSVVCVWVAIGVPSISAASATGKIPRIDRLLILLDVLLRPKHQPHGSR